VPDVQISRFRFRESFAGGDITADDAGSWKRVAFEERTEDGTPACVVPATFSRPG
jgi:hypothetical protein